MSGISTHVLDQSRGRPAAGVQVQLERCGAVSSPLGSSAGMGAGQMWKQLGDAPTDADGRCNPILPPEKVEPGIYRLTFVTGPYFSALQQETLYPEVTITFAVAPGERNYHIPLLLSPFGYSTYRGS